MKKKSEALLPGADDKDTGISDSSIADSGDSLRDKNAAIGRRSLMNDSKPGRGVPSGRKSETLASGTSSIGKRAIIAPAPFLFPRSTSQHRIMAVYSENEDGSTGDGNVQIAKMPPYSAAQQRLFILARGRKLRSFVRDHGFLTDAQYVFIWQLKEGVRFPSELIIRRLEPSIPRIEWFSPPSAALPVPEWVREGGVDNKSDPIS